MNTRFPIILVTIVTLALVGCRDENLMCAGTVSLPEELMKKRPFDPQSVLAGISIQPEGTKLGNEEILTLSATLQQIAAWAQAEGINGVVLERDMMVYKSLDASLRHIPAWVELRSQDRVDLRKAVEIIETNVRR